MAGDVRGTEFATELLNARQTHELRLWNRSLESLPPEVGRLTNLRRLDLGGNRLTSLPPEVGRLTNLQELDLGGNRLTSLPPEVGRLTNLRRLLLIAIG